MSGDSSSDDESGVAGTKWIPISERPEWSDVVPLEQDDGPDAVVKIAYSDRFLEVYNYYRGVVCTGEVSQRVLQLTKEALELNPANYSVWHHRRILLKELKADLKEELSLIRGFIEEHPKNYQVWQHRRTLIEWLNDPSNELRLTEIILSQDAKNYHAWQHRQWAVQTFNLYDSELAFVERLLKDDLRNNSAWNHRFFIVSHEASAADQHADSIKPVFREQLLQREIQFAQAAIVKMHNNESSWNYLTGILNCCEASEKEVCYRNVAEFCRNLYKDQAVRSVHLMAAMIDITTELASFKCSREQQAGYISSAMEVCHQLACHDDLIRKEYWDYVAKTIRKKFPCDS